MRISGKILLVCCALTAAAGLSSSVEAINKNAVITSFQTGKIAKTGRVSRKPKPKPKPPKSASGAKADASKYQVPGTKEMREMTRTALMDFNAAVEMGDFTDFYSKISKIWQKQVTPERFNEVFGEFIEKKVDISEIGSNNPIYTPRPAVRRDKGAKKLIAEGCYDVNPRPVKFVLKWLPEGKEWKLFGIEVDTTVASC
ncbi:MAG TPA: hypothetical protein VF721_07985 [Pyrinomonadaceae bacterium]|jgi:hypothetical protein